jgi:mRNA interferase MazF
MGQAGRGRALIKRGEVYWINLDPTVGAEIKKTRPALIVSNDVNNQHAQTVTVLPITSKTDKVYPFEVQVPAGTIGNREACKIKANQIRTVDKSRLGASMGILPGDLLSRVESAMLLHLAIER